MKTIKYNHVVQLRPNIATVLLFILSLLFVFSSCGSKVPPPTISLMAPEEGMEFVIGGDVHFDVQLSDSVMLSSYTVEILVSEGNEFNPSTEHQKTDKHVFLQYWELAEKDTAIHHHEIMIPEHAAPGDYCFVVYCRNVAGKESHVARNIRLVH